MARWRADTFVAQTTDLGDRAMDRRATGRKRASDYVQGAKVIHRFHA